MQLFNHLYQFIKLSAVGRLPRIHIFLQRFYNFCNSLTIIYLAFCRCRLPIYTIFELSSYYLSSFLQLFAAYLYFFANLQLLSVQLSVLFVAYLFFATL